STFPMSPTPCNGDDSIPSEPHNPRPAGHHWTHHHVGLVPLDCPGGSYRTMQGFFSTVIPWAILVWAFFRQHVYYPGDVCLLGADEVVHTKPGQAGALTVP